MSVDTVKSLAISMLSAGVVAKIASGLNIDITKLSKSDFLGRLEYNLAKNSVGAVVNLGMYGKYEQGAIGGVIDALLNSVLASMLDKVDTLTAAADFSESSREWTRILVAGGVRGSITGRDPMDGILSGIAEEYVTAKCNGIVAEWEREDKIRETAEAIERDGFAEDVNVRDKLAKDRFAIQDQASSSSSIKKPVSRNKYNASSPGNSSDASKGKTRERSQIDFNKEDFKYNPDDFISSIFTDPKALAEYEKYLARSGQNIIPRYDESVIENIPVDRSNKSLIGTNGLKSFIFNPRIQGVIQIAAGLGQVAASVVGGVASLETGIGPIIAAGYAGVGVDNMVSGASSVISGRSQPTLLFQAAKGVGFSDNAASWAELAVNLSPSMPGVAKEVGGLANKGLTKLYDLRKAKCSVQL